MKLKRLTAILLMLMMLLAGCKDAAGTDNTNDIDSSSDEKTSEKNTDIETESDQNAESGDPVDIVVEDMFTERDLDPSYDESSSAVIKLEGDSANCSSDAVKIDGSTITITDEGTYIISGTLDDGMIIVNADDADKPQIVLNGVDINCETSAPIYILKADKVFITLADDTENILSNGGAFEAVDDNNIDGTIFSKQDLTINGKGTLTVSSPMGHGIVCKDDLVFTGGTCNVECASHGLDVNDSVRMINTSLVISSGKDGIHAENDEDTTLGFVYIGGGSFDISAEGDGISAGTVMQIDDGTFDIITGGGSENAADQTSDSWGDFMGGGGMMPGGMGGPGGMGRRSSSITERTTVETAAETSAEDSSSEESTSIKGLKSANGLVINGGTFTMDTADDAIHSNTSVTVTNGTFNIESGDDGFHADETLSITGGEIYITESYEGLEALNVKVSGGDITLVCDDDGINAAGGTDSSGMGGMRGGDRFGGMSSSSNGSIIISGGNLDITAYGDGIDANGSLTISGGYTIVSGPTSGDTATLDYDSSAVITGGTFIGTGASAMAQTFSDAEQGIIAVQASNISGGTEILLKDAEGNTVLSYTPQLAYAVIILSSPDIISGETYTLNVGSLSESFEAA